MQSSLKKRVGSFALALILALSLAGTAFASAGDLDPTFGTGGKVTTSFPIAGWVTTELRGNSDRANAAALQPDGKMVVVGYAKGISDPDLLMGLARYNADGSLDTTFGTNGKVSDNLGFTHGEAGSAVALLPDGRIAVAGYVNNGTSDAVIALFTSSGSLDTTFNTTGYRTFDYGGNEKATSIVVQSDGKIVVGIYSDKYSANNFILVRCKSDGTLDSSFGSGGVVTTDLGAAYTEGINALAIQTVGEEEKIIAVGSSSSHSGDFAVLRYGTNGVLDTSFGASGKTFSDFGAADSGRAVAIQPGGEIVVAGSASNGTNSDFALARYTVNGTLDTTFGTGGQVVADFATGNETASAVLIQSDGKILASGSTKDGIGLARFSASGVPDADFGKDGKSTPVLSFPPYAGNAMLIQKNGRIVVAGATTYSPVFLLVGMNNDGSLDNTFGLDFASADAEAHALAIQPDGKIILAGSSLSDFNHNYDFALARYNTDGSLDASFGANGRITTNFGGELEQATAAAVQTDGKIVVAGYSGDGSTFYQLAMARYNVDGSLDTSFGTDGLVKYGAKNIFFMINDMVIQPDGKIILGGAFVNDVNPGGSFLLARYNPDGVLDTTFGDNGITLTSFSQSPSAIGSIVIQPDGMIVAAGSIGYFDDTGSHISLALARYTANGVLDTSFGVSGLTSNDKIEGADAVTLQPDGKIVAGGSFYTGSNTDIRLARYNTDGTLDSSFGTDGIVSTDFNEGSNDSLNSIVAQTDGQIVAAGYSAPKSSDDEDFALLKYNSDGTLDTSFNSTGKLKVDFHVSEVERATKVALQEDGSIILAGYTLYQPHSIQLRDFALARVENAVKPFATTDAATSVKVDRAEINGTIKAYDHDTTVTFEYGTDTSYGTIASAAPAIVTGTARTSVTYLLTELKSNTTYHYRVVAASSVGTTYGSDQTFTTSTIPFTYLPVVLK